MQPRLAAMILREFFTVEEHYGASDAWYYADVIMLLLILIEAAVCITDSDTFVKVKGIQQNVVPFGFVLPIFTQTNSLRLLGVTCSVKLLLELI